MTMTPPSPALTEDLVRQALRRVYDPEFGVSVEDLGLIYEIAINGGQVAVTMTLTSMYCPAGPVIMEGVRSAIEALPGAAMIEVDLVWTPSWTPERLSTTARTQLGWDEPQIEA